jgi:hypothetical protein
MAWLHCLSRQGSVENTSGQMCRQQCDHGCMAPVQASQGSVEDSHEWTAAATRATANGGYGFSEHGPAAPAAPPPAHPRRPRGLSQMELAAALHDARLCEVAGCDHPGGVVSTA